MKKVQSPKTILGDKNFWKNFEKKMTLREEEIAATRSERRAFDR